ncbi:hypothetical protein D0U04_17350 [Bacillus clarus]|uniref:Uncharacterized protein n=1 Tax=Bacillus clarus TaxID=2338372 RepID=A0A090YVT1_9BACI|nr:hypothetical protein [Bacillus clarus]KFN02969.1 hypothetical protein DJ93_2860 [Bacillus clarus]RFT65805.1 hypothetical protein D0U04_17350 [Bacillus clarus]
MKYRKIIYILLVLLCIVGCQSEVSKANSVEEYIPSRLMTADIMTLEMDRDTRKKVEVITKKMSDHVKNDKEWYVNYISGHIDKQVKPYHPNFGVTEEEYNFFRNAVEHSSLSNTSDGKLQFKQKSNHEIEIVSSKNLELFRHIVIDTEKNIIRTSFGECQYVGEVKASSEQRLTGPWNGKQWVLQKENLIYLFSLGKLEGGNKSIIDISVKGIHEGKLISKEKVVEFHSLS